MCLDATNEVEEACTSVAADKNKGAGHVKIAHSHLLQVLTRDDVLHQLREWEARKSTNAMLKSMMNYMHQVEAILFFVSASRNADLTLHLETGEALSNFFCNGSA